MRVAALNVRRIHAHVERNVVEDVDMENVDVKIVPFGKGFCVQEFHLMNLPALHHHLMIALQIPVPVVDAVTIVAVVIAE